MKKTKKSNSKGVKNINKKLKPKLKFKSKSKSIIKFKSKPKSRSKIKSKSKPKLKSKTKSKSKPRFKPKLNIKKVKKVESKKIKKLKKPTKKNFILKLINFQNFLKPKINFRINISIEKYIQAFFDKIANTISEYKIAKKDEARRIELEQQEKERLDKIKLENEKIKEQELKIKLKEQALKDEIKLDRQRAKDIKIFLRKEQALLRIEQAEKQKQFLIQLRLEKQIEKFRIREVKELEKLEKISLKEKRDDYAGLQQRIEKLKEKYRIIRDQKIRERVEALGVKIQGDEDRETLLRKEKEYTLARQKIEFALESFYRSASSLVFQLNKRHITRHMSIFRCIDKRFETGEIFVKWDESPDEEWLLLIYIKDNSPDEGIVIEDKSNPEKNISHEFKNNEIFKASDTMVDSLTQLIARKRAKNNN